MNSTMKVFSGTLIVSVEGPPGAGKTTLIESLLDYFRKIVDVDQFSFENVEESEQIKELANQRGGNEKILLLQALHVGQDNAITSLLRGHPLEMLILDKSFYHMFAYNKVDGVPFQSMDWIKKGIVNIPDLVLYLQAPLEVSRSRKPGSKIFEDMSKARRLKFEYDEMAQKEKWVIIDATQFEAEVLKSCIQAIENFSHGTLDFVTQI